MPDPRIANEMQAQQGAQPAQAPPGQPGGQATEEQLIEQARAEIAQMPRPELEELAFALVMEMHSMQGGAPEGGAPAGGAPAGGSPPPPQGGMP